MSGERGSGAILASGFATAMRLLISVACARLLGGADYGQMACLVILVEMASLILDLGIADATVRRLPREEGLAREELAARVASVHAGVVVLVAGVVALLAPVWPGVAAGGPAWWATVAYALGRGVGAIGSSQLAGRQRWGLLSRLWMAGSALTAAGTTSGAWAGGVAGCLLGMALGAAVPALGLASVRWRWSAAPGHSGFARAALGCWMSGSITALVWTRGELLFLQRSVTEAVLGSYVATLAISGLPVLLGGVLGTTLIPRLAASSTREDRSATVELVAAAVRLVSMAVLPLVAVLVVATPALVSAAYGPAFVCDRATAAVLAAGSAAVCFSPATALLHAVGAFRILVIASLVATAVLALGGALVVPGLDTLGAATARIAAQASLIVIHIIALREHGAAIPWRSWWRLLLASAIPAATTAAAIVLLPGSLLALASAALAGGMAYLGVVRRFHLVTPADRLRLHAAAAVLPSFCRTILRMAIGPAPA